MQHALIEFDEYTIGVEYKVEGIAPDARTMQYHLESATRTDEDGLKWDLRGRQVPLFRSRNELLIETAIWKHVEAQEALVLAQMQDADPGQNYDYAGPRNYVPMRGDV